MSTVEEKILQVIEMNGKVLDLSLLSAGYQNKWGASLPKPSTVKTSSWLKQFKCLVLYKYSSKCYVGLKETRDHIQTILLNNGGALSIVNLCTIYEQTYEEQIPNPKGIDQISFLKGFENISVACQPKGAPQIILDKFDNQGNQPLLKVISSESDLTKVLSKETTKQRLCIHCETLKDDTIVLAFKGSGFCVVIDCNTLGQKAGLMIEEHIKKSGQVCLVHGLFEHLNLFDTIGLAYGNDYFFDTQLAMELLTGNMSSTLVELANYLRTPTIVDNSMFEKNEVKRPFNINDTTIRRIIKKINVLHEVGEVIPDHVDEDKFEHIMAASATRSKQSYRDIRFILDKDYMMCSYELALCLYPIESISPCMKLEVHNEVESILELLPFPMKEELLSLGTEHITDLSLDLKRPPHCWWKGERRWLTCEIIRNLANFFIDSDENLVEASDLQGILAKVGEFGSDNRSGLEGALHRISCIRNRKCDIIGLTIRFGRYVSGNVDMIRDILCGMSQKSILFLGEPGSGKTTIVREAVKCLSESENVFVVDTSNEIAGDGDLPHPCIGNARRLMVGSLKEQANVMIECVQNHTPSIMVIDEIGRSAEVDAAKTSKNRGVRIVASAHGDLRSLIKNTSLRGLIGGLETVTLGDEEAKKEAQRKGSKQINKQKTQRAGAPIFEVVIELRRGMYNEWIVTTDSTTAVDAILDGKKYNVQKRIRDPVNGSFFIKKVNV